MENAFYCENPHDIPEDDFIPTSSLYTQLGDQVSDLATLSNEYLSDHMICINLAVWSAYSQYAIYRDLFIALDLEKLPQDMLDNLELAIEESTVKDWVDQNIGDYEAETWGDYEPIKIFIYRLILADEIFNLIQKQRKLQYNLPDYIRELNDSTFRSEYYNQIPIYYPVNEIKQNRAKERARIESIEAREGKIRAKEGREEIRLIELKRETDEELKEYRAEERKKIRNELKIYREKVLEKISDELKIYRVKGLEEISDELKIYRVKELEEISDELKIRGNQERRKRKSEFGTGLFFGLVIGCCLMSILFLMAGY